MPERAAPRDRYPYVLPVWLDRARPWVAVSLFGALPVYLVLLFWYGGSPKTTDVGYAPVQPVPFSHALHAGDLGLDCRYCHNTVEFAAAAAIPPTDTCMGCHAAIAPDSPKLAALRESYATGLPIRWVRVHDLPDYAYFDHSAHVRRGVGCAECHGPVDRMEVVYQWAPLSMGWCLGCHRDPEPHLRPPELATRMDWHPPSDPRESGAALRAALRIAPREDCSACHR